MATKLFALADHGSKLFKPCVDCGVVTSNFCDNECPAAGWFDVDSSWAPGQRTPQCRKCEYDLGVCHFCRGVKMPLPVPRATRPEDPDLKVASDWAYEASKAPAAAPGEGPPRESDGPENWLWGNNIRVQPGTGVFVPAKDLEAGREAPPQPPKPRSVQEEWLWDSSVSSTCIGVQSGTGYFLPAKDTRAVREEPPQPPRPVSKAEQGSSFSLFSRPEHPLFTSDEDTDEDGERL